MVAMVIAKRIVVLLLVLVAGPASSFYRLAGPSFYNGSTAEITIDIVYQDGPCCHLPHVPAHHFAFAEPNFHEVKTITVTALGKIYCLKKSTALQWRADVKPKDQLWIFDGAHICMIQKRDFKTGGGMQCPLHPTK